MNAFCYESTQSRQQHEPLLRLRPRRHLSDQLDYFPLVLPPPWSCIGYKGSYCAPPRRSKKIHDWDALELFGLNDRIVGGHETYVWTCVIVVQFAEKLDRGKKLNHRVHATVAGTTAHEDEMPCFRPDLV